jgi:hypothetical protein
VRGASSSPDWGEKAKGFATDCNHEGHQFPANRHFEMPYSINTALNILSWIDFGPRFLLILYLNFAN